MKKVVLGIVAILILIGCENNRINGDKTSNSQEISQTDLDYFKSLVGDTVLFTVDQSGLKPSALDILNNQLKWLNDKKFLPITIQGHADEQGTREYNLALGARRASAVKNYFLAKGIDESRINIVTYGKERPLKVCSSEDCWSKNRRAVTVVGKKLPD
jgi:peptidoglycan-associated lipoprotein